jgi:hypothetical protein
MNPQNDETPDSQSIHPTQPASPPTPFSPVINSSPTSPVMPPSAPMKPKGGRKKILLIVVGAVIAVLGIGSYTAYALWYNNPGKVSDDAFRSVLTAKSANYTGKIEFAPAKGTGSGATTIEFNGQGDQNNSQINLKVDINVAPISIKLGTSLISSKAGDLYFKIDNAKDILNTFGSFIGGDVASTPILKTIND